MPTSAALRPVVLRALAKALHHARGEGAEVTGPLADLVRELARLKSVRGRAAVASALGLTEPEFGALEAGLSDVERTEAALASGGAPAERNLVLAQVRLLSWLETVGQRVPALALSPEVDALVSEETGRKKVRALELILRSLITESYGDQEHLVARLREALSEDVVRKWQAGADRGDILTGCTFSELASLFVNREEFARYERLYADTPFLTLLKERRRTVQSFLEDIRRIRNVLAHNRRVTNLQLTLLDLYYGEIVTPVEGAHAAGGTTVDPRAFLQVSREDLDAYTRRLQEDVQGVKDDLGSLRASVMASLGEVREDARVVRGETQGLKKRTLWIGAGVAVLLAAAAVLLLRGEETKKSTEQAKEASERTEEVARRTAEDTRRTADEARRTAEEAQRTAEEARAAREAAEGAGKEVVKTVEAATERVEQSLDELRAGFAALTGSGGVIAEPKRPQEHYHNARLYEQRGDMAQAMRAYRAYFASGDLEFVDPHLKFQAFLKLQGGIAGARETYYEMKSQAEKAGSKNPVIPFAWILLLDGAPREEALAGFLEAHPDFAPALYEASRDVSAARLGAQSVADKRREKDLLGRFLAQQESGRFLSWYLDQSVASQQVEDAKERSAALATLSEATLANPVTLSANRSGPAWMVVFSIADVAKEILWRLGTEGEFKSTGFVPGVQSAQGFPLPKPMVEVPDAGRQVIQVKYVDARGRENGPFDVVFDPAAENVRSVKNILDTMKSSWLSFRDMGEEGEPKKTLLYFTALLSWRSALTEIRWGLDVDVPDRTLPFSPPDPRNPNAIGPGDTIYLEVPQATKYAVVQVTYRDGTKSEVVRIARP